MGFVGRALSHLNSAARLDEARQFLDEYSLRELGCSVNFASVSTIFRLDDGTVLI